MSEEIKIEIPENTAFGFSTVNIDSIEDLVDECTDVIISEDVSPSTQLCRPEICEAKKLVLKGCKLSPFGDKIMLRNTAFGSHVEELHGFKPINDIDEDSYTVSQSIGGSTCLYDAIFDAVAAVARHAELLDAVDVGSNAIIFILTDGMDNSSTVGPQTILDKLQEIQMKEILESVKVIIIGFNDPNSPYSDEVDTYLNEVTGNLGLDQYINAGSMTKEQAARVGGFISQSVSAQSQSLGTGGPSQNLTF